jgi:acyl-CoA synthetase (AMP-forming)/AMP-acid ligase II
MIHPYSYYPGRSAQWWPDKVALIEGEKKITYGELDERISRLANGLAGLGVKKGDRVGVLHWNTCRFVESVCAVARLGAAFVPMLAILTKKDHAYMIADSGSRVVINAAELLAERAIEFKKELHGVDQVISVKPGDGVLDFEEVLSSGGKEAPVVYGRAENLAQIIYTSGTTGKPKGVMHSYASTQAAMAAWVNLARMTEEDVNLLSLPMSHFGARLMDSAWMVGATGVIIPSPDTALIMKAIHDQRCTIMTLIPTILQGILDHPDLERYNLSSLRMIVYAAAPASETLVRRATRKFGPVLYTGFGQSEAYVLNTFMTPAEHEEALRSAPHRLISCGREGSVDVQVRLVDEQGQDVPAGEVGEACIRAPWQAAGYWNNPELTAKTFREGWLHTRDMLRKDKDGYFYVVDRKDDMIISGGYNVYPRVIEEVLYSHEAVAECAVVGVPNPKWGEAVKAVVVLKPGKTAGEEELISLCKNSLAPYNAPKSVEFVAALPKTPFGKISRREIKKKYWSDRERMVSGAE